MLNISEELAKKIERAAARRNQTVEEMLDTYADNVLGQNNPAKINFGLALAEAAEAANLQFDEPDVASRSRELLERDFANDIENRYRFKD